MNEPAITRGVGQDAAWSAWQAAAADRADAPHPDPVRSEAVPAARPLAGAAETSAAVESVSSTKEASHDAAFPQSYARFSINEKTHRISIKIVDVVTDEVIREIPSEEVQRIAEDLQALARRNSIGRRPQESDRAAGGGVDRYV